MEAHATPVGFEKLRGAARHHARGSAARAALETESRRAPAPWDSRPDHRGSAHGEAGRTPASILVVDAHDLVHWALRALLGSKPWVSHYLAASCARQGVRLACKGHPDVALVDRRVGDASGLELCARLGSVSARTSVVLMAEDAQVSTATARAAGARGFVSKAWRGEDIAAVVRAVMLGVTVFPPEPVKRHEQLSNRELEVLRLIAAGATNREIAARLYLSPHTVKDHTTALYRKMNARNRAEAVQLAQRLDLLT